MKHIIQFSGGLASAYVAYRVVEEHGKENCILMFHDTKVEHPDNKQFKEDVCNYIGCDMVEVSDGRDLWKLIKDNHTIPSNFIPFCTRILKQKQGLGFIKKHFKHERIMVYNGFGTHEPKRVAASQKYKTNKVGICSYLMDNNIPDSYLRDKIENEWKIKIPEPYLLNFEHSNCLPCFKAGISHFKMVYKHYPEAIERVIHMEEVTGHTTFKRAKVTRKDGKVIAKRYELIHMKDLVKKWDEEFKSFIPAGDEIITKVNDHIQLELAW